MINCNVLLPSVSEGWDSRKRKKKKSNEEKKKKKKHGDEQQHPPGLSTLFAQSHHSSLPQQHPAAAAPPSLETAGCPPKSAKDACESILAAIQRCSNQSTVDNIQMNLDHILSRSASFILDFCCFLMTLLKILWGRGQGSLPGYAP